MHKGDYLSESFLSDPWAVYKYHRENDPVCWSEKIGMYCVFKYNDVKEVLTSPNFTVEYPFRISEQILGKTLLDIDGERHKQLRALIAPLFENSSISKLDTMFDDALSEVFKKLMNKSSIEFMDECAKNIPLLTICKYIGIPEEDAYCLYNKLIYLSEHLDGSSGDFEKVSNYRDALRNYIENIILKKTNKGVVIPYLQSLGNTISLSENISQVMLLLAAGVETSMSTIGNVMVCLLRHKPMLQVVDDDPTTIGKIVMESIRWEPPQHDTIRFAKCNVNISGIDIRKGAALKLLLASANRDEDVYSNPEIFDPNRKDFRSASFGFGKHACLGRRFATTVIIKFYQKFFSTYRVEFSGKKIPEITGVTFRKPEKINLSLYPR